MGGIDERVVEVAKAGDSTAQSSVHYFSNDAQTTLYYRPPGQRVTTSAFHQTHSSVGSPIERGTVVATTAPW